MASAVATVSPVLLAAGAVAAAFAVKKLRKGKGKRRSTRSSAKARRPSARRRVCRRKNGAFKRCK
jgi:hypothetical protein